MPGDGGFNVDKVTEAGVLASAKWIQNRELTPDNQVAAGREIFRVECQSCHTIDAYRGIRKFIALRQWDRDRIQAMITGLDLMHNGVMPPFAGTDAERQALASFLASVQPVTLNPENVPDGKAVFERNCGMCHQVKPSDDLFAHLPYDPKAANDALKDLPNLFPRMPDLKLSDAERSALVQWVNTQRSVPATGAAAQG
jgi:mono/diheme cytochrome c family protein